MKRLFSILIILLTFPTLIFSQESDNSATDEEGFPEVYVYDSNGAGDQFLKISLGALLPLNFKRQLLVGGDATIGYYRFLSKYFAAGGEMSATYNQSIGEKILVMIPFTFGFMFQPYVGKFEFPMFAEIGFSYPCDKAFCRSLLPLYRCNFCRYFQRFYMVSTMVCQKSFTKL